MASKKQTGEEEVDYVVIADLFDGTMKKKQVVAMDAAAALAYAVDTGKLPDEDQATYRVMLASQWRRLQRAERQGRKDGKVVKITKAKRSRKPKTATLCTLKYPKASRNARQRTLGVGGT